MTKLDRIGAWQDLPRAPTSPVIRNADVEAWNSGFGLLRAAQAHVQKVQKEAHESGYAAGYQDGLRESQEAAAELITNAAAQVSQYVDSIGDRVTEAVLAATRGVLGGMPPLELVTRTVQHTIDSRLRNAADVTVRVHPDMADGVRSAMQQVQTERAGTMRITVEADASQPSRWSIELRAPDKVVNASIEQQVAALGRSMRIRLGRPPGAVK